MVAQPRSQVRAFLARPAGKFVAFVMALLLVYIGLGLWAIAGDEPQWVDDITDPVAHLVAAIRRNL